MSQPDIPINFDVLDELVKNAMAYAGLIELCGDEYRCREYKRYFDILITNYRIMELNGLFKDAYTNLNAMLFPVAGQLSVPRLQASDPKIPIPISLQSLVSIPSQVPVTPLLPPPPPPLPPALMKSSEKSPLQQFNPSQVFGQHVNLRKPTEQLPLQQKTTTSPQQFDPSQVLGQLGKLRKAGEQAPLSPSKPEESTLFTQLQKPQQLKSATERVLAPPPKEAGITDALKDVMAARRKVIKPSEVEQSNLGTSVWKGGNNSYYSKYMKYKNKYLSLKNSMM